MLSSEALVIQDVCIVCMQDLVLPRLHKLVISHKYPQVSKVWAARGP